jgi:hypothetical protein
LPQAPGGISDAYDINDRAQIVVSSLVHTNDQSVSAAVLWQRNRGAAAGRQWEIANLNGRLTTAPLPAANVAANYHLRQAVGINSYGIILAAAQATFVRTNCESGGDYTVLSSTTDRSVLLVPFETRSRDRLLTGAIRFPGGNAGYGARLVTDSLQRGAVSCSLAQKRSFRKLHTIAHLWKGAYQKTNQVRNRRIRRISRCFINTRLQPGDRGQAEHRNRFNGLNHRSKTAKAVEITGSRQHPAEAGC